MLVYIVLFTMVHPDVTAGYTTSDLARLILPITGGYASAFFVFIIRNRDGMPPVYDRSVTRVYAVLAFLGPVAIFIPVLITSFLYLASYDFITEGGAMPTAITAIVAMAAVYQTPFFADMFASPPEGEAAKGD
ncbi:MAG: hypothetical protein AAFX09_12900 [Pseudomonadota bacterium]